MALVLSLKAKNFILWIKAAVACFSLTVLADSSSEIICQVENSDDLFKVYPQQLVFKSEHFIIFQLIDGLTILIINTRTMRFNRLSNLNLLSNSTLDPALPPEPLQFFSGRCEYFKLDLTE